MFEMAQLNDGTMQVLQDFDLRPGMTMDEIRAAVHDHGIRRHGQSSPDGMIECTRDHLQIGKNVYTPGQIKQLLDAQTTRGAGRTLPEIEASLRLHKENVVRGFLGIGQDLLDAKAQLGKRGGWMEWLERMGIQQSYANKYMKLAKEVQPGTYLADLTFTKTLTLLAVPAEEREAFAQEIDAENKTAAEIKRLILERDQMKRERDSLSTAVDNARKNAEEWKQKYENRPALIQQVVETPDDYQALKMQAAHHDAEMREALDAAAEAEQRAMDAETRLAQMQMAEGQRPKGEYKRFADAVTEFFIAAQMLPYQPQLLSGEDGPRYRAETLRVLNWANEMLAALDGSPLTAEAVIE